MIGINSPIAASLTDGRPASQGWLFPLHRDPPGITLTHVILGAWVGARLCQDLDQLLQTLEQDFRL
ncbi:MAG: hypothetical protein IGQ88_13475 [Gloeomargaritaceae cyanobacterium C42_A2020_066]|nr:hypothetical protein [Gloeomargaritaceae cyanobacterium C42_A2020_066]